LSLLRLLAAFYQPPGAGVPASQRPGRASAHHYLPTRAFPRPAHRAAVL